MKTLTEWAARHRKLLVFTAGAALAIAIQTWGTSNPWVSLAVAVATGAGIYTAPNRPPGNPP